MSSDQADSNEIKSLRQPGGSWQTSHVPSDSGASRDQGRHAVVGILYEDRHFLVIRRSQFVRAPGLICFPGGGIEPGEDVDTAVKRELMEELSLPVEVLGHVWTSQTRWGTKLEWMVCRRDPGHQPKPNLEEVEEFLWMSVEMLEGRTDLLGSMPDFLASVKAGSFSDHFMDA
ncbi:MAG: NUDIX hydrolase [Pirellula sp.]